MKMSLQFPAFDSFFLQRYARNVYSQNGEDGILEEILRRLGITGGWVVESGAWDGKHLSNTFALIERSCGGGSGSSSGSGGGGSGGGGSGFRGLHIEADVAKFAELLETAKRVGGGAITPAITPVNATLQPDVDTLGDIMSRHCLDSSAAATAAAAAAGATGAVAAVVAVLSIDIDSHDYDVWKNLSSVHRPAVVVIEINSEVNPLDWKIHGRDGWALGTSFLPMLLLGVSKGYSLVAHTGNMIFVRNDLYPTLGLPLPNPFSLFWTRWLLRM